MNTGILYTPGVKATEEINLSGDTAFTVPPRAIYVGTGGDLKIDSKKRDGSSVTLTYKDVAAGRFTIECCTKVYSTGNGTTAADLIAEW